MPPSGGASLFVSLLATLLPLSQQCSSPSCQTTENFVGTANLETGGEEASLLEFQEKILALPSQSMSKKDLSIAAEDYQESGEIFEEKLKAERSRRKRKSQKEKIHICLLSDRAEGLIATLLSTALNTHRPDRLVVWIVTDDRPTTTEAIRTINNKIPGGTGMKIHIIDLEDVTRDLVNSGINPVWLWKDFNTSVSDTMGTWNRRWANEFTARPFPWDHSLTHMHPLNHLRFYLPMMKQFSRLERVLFFDDDIIVQGDVRKAWNAGRMLARDRVMMVSCETWGWNASTKVFMFQGGTSTFAETGALPLAGRIQDDTICNEYISEGCVGRRHWRNIKDLMMRINGQRFAPESQLTWNYGFVLIDLQSWRILGMTKRYEQWMQANYHQHIFPETSLMYGLGIPFLAFYNRTQCWRDVLPKTKFRNGLGYITYTELAFNGLDDSYLNDAYVLHYNGHKKPYSENADPIFSVPYEQTVMGVPHEEYVELMRRKHNQHRDLVRDSFIMLAEPMTGSKWLIDQLDQNSKICTGSNSLATSNNPSSISFPMGSIGNSVLKKLGNDKDNRYTSCYWSFFSEWVPRVNQNHRWCEGNTTGLSADEIRHIPKLCAWIKENPRAQQGQDQLFLAYMKLVLRGNSQIWSCQCPKDTEVMGTRIMTEWIEYNGGVNLNSEFRRPIAKGIRENGDLKDLAKSTKEIGKPSLWATLKKIRPKILFFRQDAHLGSIPGQFVEIEQMKAEQERMKAKRHFIQTMLQTMGLSILYLDYSFCSVHTSSCLRQVEKFLGVKKAHYSYDNSVFRLQMEMSQTSKIFSSSNIPSRVNHAKAKKGEGKGSNEKGKHSQKTYRKLHKFLDSITEATRRKMESMNHKSSSKHK
ncbi:hypothetical protein AAMO2058_000270600 [Amorphochlora amoebiformis]